LTAVVDISSDYTAPPDQLFAMACDYEELAAICAPLVTFTGLPSGGAVAGQSLDLHLRLCGVLPALPPRSALVPRAAPARACDSRESGGFITQWDHRITVTPTSGGATLRDHVRIEAGWLTGTVTLWARFFYHHRHRQRHARISHHSATVQS